MLTIFGTKAFKNMNDWNIKQSALSEHYNNQNKWNISKSNFTVIKLQNRKTSKYTQGYIISLIKADNKTNLC